jgi:hypothetical protein
MDPIYTQLVKEIEELTVAIENLRTEIENYLKMGNVFNGPSGIRGIDYTQDRVSTSGTMSFSDVLRRIYEKERILQPQIRRLETLKTIKIKFEELYQSDKDLLEAKIFYFRVIKKYTQKKTALELGYSERQIQRIEKKINI